MLAKISFQLALALWIGTVVCVSFVVAPVVFQTAPRETAGLVMGSVFVVYYWVTALLGVVALGAALVLWRRSHGAGSWRATVVLLAVMLCATTYAGAVVNPRARALRPALHHEPLDPERVATFQRLHRRAVALNGLVLVLGLGALGLSATMLRLPNE